MNPLERAVGTLARFLEEHQVPYMLIGGIANLVWGEPRSTLDVDASVLVEESAWPHLIQKLRRSFRVIPKRPMAFLRDTHVLPIETSDRVRIDLLWAKLLYEHRAIARASVEDLAGPRVRVCRPEDLVIHKIVSDRPKDYEDMRGIVSHQRSRLDQRYLIQMVRNLATALDRPDMLAFLKRRFAEHHR